jgi:phosphopentomutase
MRAFLVVLDSVGIGAAPDAAAYGDEGASTLAHCAAAAGGLRMPVLARMGLGNIPALLPGGLPVEGVPPQPAPTACWGAMAEVSAGKDTTTGHWEIAGLALEKGFHLFPKGPPSFPADLVAEFERRTGRRLAGNRAASGTAIIEELGERQLKDGCWIAYTSADSVFQIAAHEEVIPLAELYRACRVARELCDRYPVGRVIARPYVGRPGSFCRTANRRDFSWPPPQPTVLDRLSSRGVPVVAVGKLDDIFAGRGVTSARHVETSREAAAAVLELALSLAKGLVFANLIDFDMLYGHRRDARGYALALEEADAFAGKLASRLREDDVMIVTADHGNDPTFRGTDHTREFVPLLAFGPRLEPRSLGVRRGFYDVGQSLASLFGIEPLPRGSAFLSPPTPAGR